MNTYAFFGVIVGGLLGIILLFGIYLKVKENARVAKEQRDHEMDIMDGAETIKSNKEPQTYTVETISETDVSNSFMQKSKTKTGSVKSHLLSILEDKTTNEMLELALKYEKENNPMLASFVLAYCVKSEQNTQLQFNLRNILQGYLTKEGNIQSLLLKYPIQLLINTENNQDNNMTITNKDQNTNTHSEINATILVAPLEK